MQVISGKLYSASDDGTMRIWRLDAELPQQQQLLLKHRPSSCPTLMGLESSSRLSSAQSAVQRQGCVSAV